MVVKLLYMGRKTIPRTRLFRGVTNMVTHSQTLRFTNAHAYTSPHICTHRTTHLHTQPANVCTSAHLHTVTASHICTRPGLHACTRGRALKATHIRPRPRWPGCGLLLMRSRSPEAVEPPRISTQPRNHAQHPRATPEPSPCSCTPSTPPS